MSPTLRCLGTALILLCSALRASATQDTTLERGTAIIDPSALRELDRGRFGLTRVLMPERSVNIPLTNDRLFALPSMAPVRKSLDDEYERYIANHKANLPNERIDVGTSLDFQLFGRTLLYSPGSRFVLSVSADRM